MNGIARNITLFVVMFLLSFAAGISAEKKFDATFDVRSGGKLILKTDVGTVRVEGTGGNQVIVQAQMNGKQRDIDEFVINANENSTGVLVTGKSSRGSRWWNWGSGLEVTYTIKVPRDYSVDVNTAGGDVTIASVNGKLTGGTSGGNITITDISGDVNLETSGGDIRAEKIRGLLKMETSGGNIRIAEVKGDVDVGTSGGNIAINSVEGKVRAETSGGNITMTVRESYNGVYAETSGGNIDIKLPKNISATVDASTSGGDISCDYPITMSGKFDGSELRGTINGGGNKIYAHTSGGNIRIRSTE